MKYLTFTSLLLLNSLLCAQTPSQNPQLNAISPSAASKKSEGTMQKSLDSWIKKDEKPTQEKLDKEEKPVNSASQEVKKEVVEKEAQESPFKLQTYIDKWKD